MQTHMRAHATANLLFLLPLGLLAGGNDRDFSGTWTLDEQQSSLRGLPASPGPLLTIDQQGAAFRCTEAGVSWSFRVDGSESKYQFHDSNMSSAAKWEGSALLINTLVSGPQNYVAEDRWELSRNQALLTI